MRDLLLVQLVIDCEFPETSFPWDEEMSEL
jgi:hypothetical protein